MSNNNGNFDGGNDDRQSNRRGKQSIKYGI